MLSGPNASVQASRRAAACSRQRARVQVGDVWLDALTEREVINIVRDRWAAGCGGAIFTINTDILRAVAHNSALGQLVATGSLVVADGMPLVWAARLAGDALPERVTGSSLVFSLSEAAAADGRSVFLLGGADGVPVKAAEALCGRFPTLHIAGTDSPPFGFDLTEEGIRRTISTVTTAVPDLVYVGLGFPRQEQLIHLLRRALPDTWFLACGGGIPIAAGVFNRARPSMQRLGLEWVHRMVLEPHRLSGRYLRDDLPFAIGLIVRSALRRIRRRRQRLPGSSQSA
jgi:N-acetylglucosaminyldiphosphoundecaprenol N-acetyl-beta-D-mannosaminyltransferase